MFSALNTKTNVIVGGESGSGKSLCCILYTLNHILSEPNRSAVTKLLQDRSFSEIFPEFSSSAKAEELPQSSKPHGALVLVPTRELILQHYRWFRQLDVEGRFAIHRTTSIADLAGIARNTVKAKQRPGENINDAIIRYGFANQVKTLDWRVWDVAISTPKIFNEIIRQKAAQGQMNINPAIVLLDECDILLLCGLDRDEVYGEITRSILQRLSGGDRQYILACSTLSPPLKKSSHPSLMKKWFKDIVEIQSPLLHTFSSTTEFEYVQVTESSDYESDGLNTNESLSLLVDTVLKSESAKIVVFAAYPSRALPLQEVLESHGVASVQVFGEMVIEQRIRNLSRYLSGEVRVLIGGEVACRGLALDCDHVILYDIPHNLGQLLHKVGRTGRMGRKGKVTCFVKPDDEAIVSKIRNSQQFEVSYPTRSLRKSAQEKNFADFQQEHELSELSD